MAGIGKLKKKFFGGDIYLLYKLLLLSWASKTQRKLRDRSKNLNSEEDRGYYYSSDRIIKDYAYYGLCVFRRGHLVNFIALWSSKSQHTRESRKLGRKWIRDFKPNRNQPNWNSETTQSCSYFYCFLAMRWQSSRPRILAKIWTSSGKTCVKSILGMVYYSPKEYLQSRSKCFREWTPCSFF